MAIALQDRIREFLPALRLGIDFGEHTGGIALVRGNRVVHAETYLDFHAATLEQRRMLRRSRRSRHSKKMRLARLRSWALRQRLPSGKRLPDPYCLMRDPHYWTQPGIYGSSGTQPEQAPSWVELAKQGSVTPAGFVRALTLIFQKRGYKWDAIALDQMNDVQLKDFLASARVPTDALEADIRKQIDFRKADPANPARGRKKIPVEELEKLLEEARHRLPQPRLAEHRSVKEDELRAVIEGFGHAAGLPAEIAQRWKNELVGLLNKVLRPARFENRLKSGCSWCGKATPRKAKVRDLAYWAAVNNLRIRKWPYPAQPLSAEQVQKSEEWWSDPEKAPGAESIRKHLLKIGAQKEMARQLYDLLKNPSPKGRASLCAEHLAMAAKGKTLKEAGVEWQSISVRKAPNPCRESRDARILHRLERLLFKRKANGESAWRFGPVEIITLEVPEPQTERPRKGEQKQRQETSLRDRLLAEFGGRCAYSAAGECSGEFDKDHIFPRSRGGPDLQINLVPACKAHNDAKGDRTPFEWLRGPESDSWRAFVTSLAALPVPGRKKEILINEFGEFPPGSPTALARAGARPRQFVVGLRQLFRRHGAAPPRLDYHLGEPLVQRLQGSETARLRRSWLKKADGSDNFPLKDRASTYNHAEDAALLAAAPPHTWRDLIFCKTAVRPDREGQWKEIPGLADPELAPDWAEFQSRRAQPLVRILGHYPVTWKTTFADQTFGRSPEDLTETKLRISVPVNKLAVSEIPKLVSDYWRDRLKALAEELGVEGKRTFPEEKLRERFPKLRSVQLRRQPGGTLARVKPADGPPRKLQIKPASEGVVVWQATSNGKKPRPMVSVLRPVPMLRLGFGRYDPEIPAGAEVLCRLRRHQTVWLDASPKHPAGFFRVTKCQRGGITVAPEQTVPRQIEVREGSQSGPSGADEENQDPAGKITVGKAELAQWALLNHRNGGD